ncbi:MAG: PQQ-binding-like beta-propeller repeat protein [Acidobacteria bacterium]|nr:PQQ-binding-like beta-propeller repeat protein [Acidobacteriota bacterium]
MTLFILVAILLFGFIPAPQSTSVHMIAVEGEGAKYWPRWRGPSGQGLVTGTGYPDTWTSTQNILWKTPAPGRGHSSPIVWGDRIFLTTAYDNGAKMSLLAYKRSDGSLAWEAVAPAGSTEAIYPKNSHASATPATDGQRIYVSFGSRGLMAFDMNGKLAWRQDLGPINNYHGTAGSPLLYNDRVILYQDQPGGAFIAAFDARTGKELWRTRRTANVGWGSPVAVRAGDHDEIVVNGQHAVVAYDPQSGRELWRCGGMTFEVIPTPVVANGMVFCSSGRAGPTLAIKPGGTGDVARTHLVWSSPRGSPFVPSPIVVGPHLYLVNDMASIVTAFEASSGRTLWQERLGVAKREGFSASPVAVDGKVFFTNDDGETFVLRAGAQFQLLRVNNIGETTLASPALVDGKWYVRTDRRLVAIGMK